MNVRSEIKYTPALEISALPLCKLLAKIFIKMYRIVISVNFEHEQISVTDVL